MTRPPLPVSRFRRALLRWFDRRRRDLPWRKTKDPYRIWLSEVMLQQTTVAAVVPHYERFLALFPDLRALAAAGEREVLAAWSGLGYYARARNLHRAARAIVAEHGGRLPRTAEGLRPLPGFGPYTAAAVASIAFGQPSAVVDGNVIRVVARLAALDGHAKEPQLAAEVADRAARWIDPGRPGDFNQAMMELGATLCRPATPLCGECPVAFACWAGKDGSAPRRPAVPPRRETVAVRLAAGLFVDDAGRLLLRHREGTGFLDGLLELPSVTATEGGDAASLLGDLFRSFGLRKVRVAPSGRTVRQAITFRTVEVELHLVEGEKGSRLAERGDVEWHPVDLPLPLPSLFRKAAAAGLEALEQPLLPFGAAAAGTKPSRQAHSSGRPRRRSASRRARRISGRTTASQ